MKNGPKRRKGKSENSISSDMKEKRLSMETGESQSLLKRHRLHLGVYARVAEDLEVDPSYISRVANGERQSEKVKRAILVELKRIEKLTRNGAH